MGLTGQKQVQTSRLERLWMTRGRDGDASSVCGLAAEKMRESKRTELLQFCVFGFGFFEDWDVGVGVFPEGQKVFVGGEGADAGSVGIGAF